ncbi:MAG: hypothetical protein QM775_12120 [Pirellulales bacterium]
MEDCCSLRRGHALERERRAGILTSSIATHASRFHDHDIIGTGRVGRFVEFGRAPFTTLSARRVLSSDWSGAAVALPAL